MREKLQIILGNVDHSWFQIHKILHFMVLLAVRTQATGIVIKFEIKLNPPLIGRQGEFQKFTSLGNAWVCMSFPNRKVCGSFYE